MQSASACIRMRCTYTHLSRRVYPYARTLEEAGKGLDCLSNFLIVFLTFLLNTLRPFLLNFYLISTKTYTFIDPALVPTRPRNSDLSDYALVPLDPALVPAIVLIGQRYFRHSQYPLFDFGCHGYLISYVAWEIRAAATPATSTLPSTIRTGTS